jgi:hypothetical protein
MMNGELRKEMDSSMNGELRKEMDSSHDLF